mgnify:CR=1 FL=1
MDVSFFMPLIVVLIFNLGDIVTGFAQGAYTHTISSTKMRDGLWHKAGFVLLMVTAYAIDWAGTQLDLGIGVPLVVPVAVFIVLTELVSILENLSEMIPQLKGSRLMELFHSAKMDEMGIGDGKED